MGHGKIRFGHFYIWSAGSGSIGLNSPLNRCGRYEISLSRIHTFVYSRSEWVTKEKQCINDLDIVEFTPMMTHSQKRAISSARSRLPHSHRVFPRKSPNIRRPLYATLITSIIHPWAILCSELPCLIILIGRNVDSDIEVTFLRRSRYIKRRNVCFGVVPRTFTGGIVERVFWAGRR